MKLIDIVRSAPHRMTIPLMGFPGAQLTNSTLWQNEFNAELQYRSIKALVERFKPDAAFFMMDLSVEAGAIGIPILFPANGSPTVNAHLVKSIKDLTHFEAVDIRYDGRVRTYAEIMRLMNKNLEILKGAYVIGPFTLAGLMMGATEIAMATIEDPELVRAAASFATQTIIQYGQILVEAGADMIVILEPTATFISPKAFKKFSGTYVEQIVEALGAISILHICGDTKHLIEAMCETGVQGLSLDAPLDMVATVQKLPEDVVLIGNIDPVRIMINEQPEGVKQAVFDLMDVMASYPNFILSTGCDLPPETPLENISAFMAAAAQWNQDH